MLLLHKLLLFYRYWLPFRAKLVEEFERFVNPTHSSAAERPVNKQEQKRYNQKLSKIVEAIKEKVRLINQLKLQL